jgi:hypothetical protein
MSNSLFTAFTYEQIDTLRTSLDMRLDRINDLIKIFSKDPENKEDQWMIARYNKERVEAETLLQELTNATSFLPTA